MDDFAEITSVEELETAINEANEAARPLVERGRAGETLTAEERATLRETLARRDAAQTRLSEVQAQAEADAAEQEDLLSQFDEPEAEAETPEAEAEVETPEPEATAEDTPAAEPEQPAEPVAEEAPMPEAVAASAARRTPPARRAVPRPEVEQESQFARQGAQVAITASASLGDFGRGSPLELADVATMLGEQGRAYPEPNGTRDTPPEFGDLKKDPIAKFTITRDDAFTLTGDEESDMEKVKKVLNPDLVDGGNGALGLTAAGGWCAPSENLYDIPVVGESLDGMVSVPEMNAARGGVKSTLGPDFATLYAAIGFEQTEAQAISGTAKTCYSVDCPTFTETRLDVKGVCILVPILTEAGYPEYVERITSGALVVHAHKMNAYKLAKMDTASGAAIVVTGVGSVSEDALRALELRAEFTRTKYRMAFDETLEVILPHWARAYLRGDLALRMGLDPRNPITDQVLDAHFTARHLAVQWVYDWQTFADPNSAAPTTFNALIYPAGTFLALTKDVISLSSVYDSAGLQVNTYTGTFTEEGIAIRKMSGVSEKVTIPICASGEVGAADIACV